MRYIAPSDLEIWPSAKFGTSMLNRIAFTQGEIEWSQMAHGGFSDHDGFGKSGQLR